jgi:hypothetical protein
LPREREREEEEEEKKPVDSRQGVPHPPRQVKIGRNTRERKRKRWKAGPEKKLLFSLSL